MQWHSLTYFITETTCGPNWSNGKAQSSVALRRGNKPPIDVLMLYVQYTITRMLADIRFGRLI